MVFLLVCMLNLFKNFIIVLNFKCFILNFFKNLFVVFNSCENIFEIKNVLRMLKKFLGRI